MQDSASKAASQLKSIDNATTSFISVASHKLRTPLSGIIGYVSMLLDGDFGELQDKEHKKVLTTVFSASKNLSSLVDTFLHVSDLESGEMQLVFEPIDFVTFVQQHMNEVEEELQSDAVTVETNFSEVEDLYVMLDTSFREVIRNIFDNALRYTETGKVRVELQQRDDATVRLSFIDTGIGVDPEEVQHLFKKFSRGASSLQMYPDGSGLGLYIVKRIVDGHNGDVFLETAGEGKGVTVHITIPKKQHQGTAAAGPETIAEHMQHSAGV